MDRHPGRSRASYLQGVIALCLLASATGCAGASGPPRPTPEQIPALESRVEDRPQDADALARLGAAYLEAGRAEQARRVLERARAASPGHGPTVFFLGLTYEELERYGEAGEVYSSYLESGGDPPLGEEVRNRLRLVRRNELAASVRDVLRREEEIADRAPSAGTIGIFPFLYRGEPSRFRPLGRALAEFLVTDLSRTGRVEVLERMRVQLLLDEMALADSGYVDPATAARSGRLLGAGRIVQGLLEGSPGTLRAEAAVVDAGSPPASLRPSVSGSASPDDVFELQTRLALGLYRDLGIELTPAERERVTRRPTESLDALLSFGRGLVAEDSAHYARAAEHYRQAAQIDPDFDLALERARVMAGIASALDRGRDALATVAVARFFPATHRRDLFDPGRAVGETGSFSDGERAWRGGGFFLPIPGQRDAVTEVLGFEGLTDHPAEFRIIISPMLGDWP